MAAEGGGDVGRGPNVEELERLLAERGDQLMRVAVALTGRREDAEDLLQAALERLLRNWRGVQGDTEGYLRRTLYNLAADGWRRRGTWRRKVPLLRAERATGGADTGAGGTAQVDLRDTLVRLLRQLPPRQRAVIVLRYWEQLSETEVAAMLGCSEGTVKSAASRGLRRLRELAGSRQDAGNPPAQGAAQPAQGAAQPAQGAAQPAQGAGSVSAQGNGRARPRDAEIELTAGINLMEGRS
jgi:RNA polymerase sigma-70 factor (sigma-E family)